MPRNTVSEVLECFDNEFANAASAFVRGEYVLWLGSGISRDVVPGVPKLLERMLDFLQTSIDATDPTCRFKIALDEVLEVAAVPEAIRESIDFTMAVSTWPGLWDIVQRLVDRYADVLDVQVKGEDNDFLVWDGLKVSSTYGAPNLDPDVEHLCVALLMLEGVVRSALTTNWDGLVEAAMERLGVGDNGVLSVIVKAADFAAPGRRAELVKFHGCAVRSAHDPGVYRNLLIARKSQISGWTTKPQNKMMKNHLEHLFASRPAFVVGLSAQDANIHTVLHEASQNLARSWPTEPPAVVFAEHKLHHHHKHMMRVTYGDEFSANSHAIESSALLGAYAKPTLLGLVMFTLTDKLSALIGYITELDLSDPELERLQADIRGVRDALGEKADADPRSFTDAVVSALTLALSVFRKGSIPNPAPYVPVSVAPIADAVRDPDFPHAALGRFALAIALLGRGLLNREWTLEPGCLTSPVDGVLRVKKGGRTSKIFIVRDARVLSELELAGTVDMKNAEVVVVQAEAAYRPRTRSPRARYGRSGKSGARQVDIETMCASVSTVDELFEAFVLEGAL
ncbi:SIR2 family protein [Rhodococcus sp. UFZ-B548]|uniref:SIR2 family protein n=1 Tax=Rhodococcus sp. UFZ-B548 TaxID=2742212 RepID=UPI0015F71147|nr:SIR2 family protein [Rhodococcus sp. UFZ-B548]